MCTVRPVTIIKIVKMLIIMSSVFGGWKYLWSQNHNNRLSSQSITDICFLLPALVCEDGH